MNNTNQNNQQSKIRNKLNQSLNLSQNYEDPFNSFNIEDKKNISDNFEYKKINNISRLSDYTIISTNDTSNNN